MRLLLRQKGAGSMVGSELCDLPPGFRLTPRNFRPAHGKGQDIYGNDVTLAASEKYECMSCHRQFLPAKFAQHLEKCLGLGRTGMRAAARSANAAISNETKSVPSEQETESDGETRKRKRDRSSKASSSKKKSNGSPASSASRKSGGAPNYSLDAFIQVQPGQTAVKPPTLRIKLPANRPAMPSPLQHAASIPASEQATPTSASMSTDWNFIPPGIAAPSDSVMEDAGETEDDGEEDGFPSLGGMVAGKSIPGFAGKTVPGMR